MQSKSGFPRGTLTKELILQAALEIIDQEGLDGLSLRRIAAYLGVSTMSLYRHYRSKAEIEFDIVDHVVGNYDVINHAEADWVEWIYSTFSKMREGLCAHPGLMSLLDRASFNASYQGVNALEVMETILLKLHDAGLTPKQSVQLFHMLMAFMIGSVVLMNEESRRAISAGNEDAGEQTRMRKLSFEMVPVKQFPNIAEKALFLAEVWEVSEFRSSLLQIVKSFAILPGKPKRSARKSGK